MLPSGRPITNNVYKQTFRAENDLVAHMSHICLNTWHGGVPFWCGALVPGLCPYIWRWLQHVNIM